MYLNYAFIMNSKSLTPEIYAGSIKSETFNACFYGVNSMKMAANTVQKLASEGFGHIDLCGDFDEAAAEEMQALAGEQTKISNMKYFPEELEKLESLDDMGKYGIIIIDNSFRPDIRNLVMKSDEFDTHIAAVKDLDHACHAAQILVSEGINFIELSSGFNADMTKIIIEKIGGKVPVGFAGKK